MGRYVDENMPNCFRVGSFCCPPKPLRPGVRPTVIIATSGNESTEKQCRMSCRMFVSLGFDVRAIDGLEECFVPPKSWRIGCRATFAWSVVILRKIVMLLNACSRDDYFLVAEDSCWPTDRCTPHVVLQACRRYGNVWLAGALKPKRYQHSFHGHVICNTVAQAGCKLFVGSKQFWEDAQNFMMKLDKGWSTDATFQALVGMRRLHLLQPALGGCMSHYRTRHSVAPVEWVSASAPPFDGKLLELGVHSDSSSSDPVSPMAFEPVTLIQQQCLPADPARE